MVFKIVSQAEHIMFSKLIFIYFPNLETAIPPHDADKQIPEANQLNELLPNDLPDCIILITFLTYI